MLGQLGYSTRRPGQAAELKRPVVVLQSRRGAAGAVGPFTLWTICSATGETTGVVLDDCDPARPAGKVADAIADAGDNA